MTRRDLLQNELVAFTEAVKSHYHPEKIIVFGSFAADKVTENSDLDVIVVAESDQDFWSRLSDLSRYCSHRVGMDVLFYTPREYHDLVEKRTFFRDEISSKGKVIYDRSQSS